MKNKFIIILVILFSTYAFSQASVTRENNITMTRGDSVVCTLKVIGDKSDHALSFAVKEGTAFTDPRLIQKDTSDGISLSYSSPYTYILVTIKPEDTQDLTAKYYYYDVYDSTTQQTIVNAYLTIKSDVQTPFDGTDLPEDATRITTVSLDNGTTQGGVVAWDTTETRYNTIPIDSLKKLTFTDTLTQAQKDSINAMIDMRNSFLEVGVGKEYGTIEDALDVATENDIILIANGTYDLSAFSDTIAVPIKIIGQHRDSTILVFDKSNRDIGFWVGNSFWLENLTIKTANRPIWILPMEAKEIPHFIIRNVVFDDIVERCVTGFYTSIFANVTRFYYGEISGCIVKNSDGGFRIENIFKYFNAFNNYFHNIQDTISEPRSAGFNNGAIGFYIGNPVLSVANDSGYYNFHDNYFHYFRSELGQLVSGVDVTNNALYVPDNSIDSNDLVVIKAESLTDTIPAGITQPTEYRVVYSENDTIKLSLTSGGSPIDITSEGVGTFHAFSPSETHAVLCYGKFVSVKNNTVNDFSTDFKYDSEVFYIRGSGNSFIDGNTIYNGGSGDGIIVMKAGNLPEQSSISNNYIYKDNGDYLGDAIKTTMNSKVNNNTIILLGDRTGIGTAGGIYIDKEAESVTHPVEIIGNMITIENEDNAISIKANTEGDVLVANNQINLDNGAVAFRTVTNSTWGVDPDSLFLSHLKFTGNVINGQGSGEIIVSNFTGGADITDNTFTVDSLDQIGILTQNIKPYVNIKDNSFYLKSVLDNNQSLIQVSSNDCDIRLENNGFYLNDGVEIIFIMPSGADNRSLIIKNNALAPADSGVNDIGSFFYVQGNIEADLIIENNINIPSNYIDLEDFILLRDNTANNITIKDNIASSLRFIRYRDTVTTSSKTILRGNKYTGSNFLYPSVDASWSKGFEYISDNVGYKTANVGTTTIPSGSDSVIINHGLNITPSISNIILTPQSNLKGKSYYIDSVDAHTFKIKLGDTSFSAISEDLLFSWNINDRITVLPFNPFTFDDNTIAIFDGDEGLSDTLWVDAYNDYDITLTGSPTIMPDAIGGHDALLFDGVNDRGATSNFGLAQPTTIYIVLKQVTWTLNDYIIGSTNGTTRGILKQTDTSPELKATADASAILYSDSILVPLDTYSVVSIVFNGASSLMQYNQETAVTGDFGSEDMGGLILADRSSTGLYGNVEIAYIIVRKISDDADTRLQFQDWLIERFGL